MTPDRIKELAKQAGGTPYVNRHYPDKLSVAFNPSALIEFVRLVQADEREACAKVCETMGPVLCESYGDGAECIATAEACAEQIRARGTQDARGCPDSDDSTLGKRPFSDAELMAMMGAKA